MEMMLQNQRLLYSPKVISMNSKKIRKIKNKRFKTCLAKKSIRKKSDHKKIKFKRPAMNWHLRNEKISSIKDTLSGDEITPHLLLEYSSIYPNVNFDLEKEIRNFSRSTLLNIALVLGKNYGSYKLSDLENKPFFSYDSSFSRDRMQRLVSFLQSTGYSSDMVSYACERTILEFLKLTFSVDCQECKTVYENWEAEAKIFDLLLAINEQKITKYEDSNVTPGNISQLIYTSFYATNEFTNYDSKLVLAEQLYYARLFFEFITSRSEYESCYNCFLNKFEIHDWLDYFRTIVVLAFQSIHFGLGLFNLERNDPSKLVNRSVLSHISIQENETIAYTEKTNEMNRDFVVFRTRPIIEMINGDYLIFNHKLIIERLYNSIYFDLIPYQRLLKISGKSYQQFYKEVFVEKYLFGKTILSCVNDELIDKYFPPKLLEDCIDYKEDVYQPDFYIREGNALFIFECKAVKLNGDLKKKADVDAIIEELKNKLVMKTWQKNGTKKQQLSSPKNEGVGQLVSHIERIEENDFKWDTSIPENAIYYPVLVLESRELLQLTLSSIVNDWYYELLKTKHTIQIDKCRPVIIMTINTLFLYNTLFHKNGFKYYFDCYFSECMMPKDGKMSMSLFSDFNNWMTKRHQIDKVAYYEDTVRMLENNSTLNSDNSLI